MLGMLIFPKFWGRGAPMGWELTESDGSSVSSYRLCLQIP